MPIMFERNTFNCYVLKYVRATKQKIGTCFTVTTGTSSQGKNQITMIELTLITIPKQYWYQYIYHTTLMHKSILLADREERQTQE